VGNQIGFERTIKIKENQEDDEGNEPNPELLLFGCLFRHIAVSIRLRSGW
jgi:hypothetical protein